MNAPTCATCGTAAVLTTGREIWPHRPDLRDLPVWRCTVCPDARVGCHPGTTDPLGTPADPELRRARSILHKEALDPIWRNAPSSGAYGALDEKGKADVRRAARVRVYRWLAAQLGIEGYHCHVGHFTLEQCRAAWPILRGATYPAIRAWTAENAPPLSPRALKRQRKRARAAAALQPAPSTETPTCL